jgi:hypothetical protein
MFSTLDAAAQILFMPIPHIRASLGAGVERRLLYGLTPAVLAPTFDSSFRLAQTREYGEANLTLNFNPASLRRDRHHLLSLGARVYGPSRNGGETTVHLSGAYQKMFAFGWNELWVEMRGSSRTGAVVFPEESSVGSEVLRGPFAGIYVRRYAGLDLEYRFSLLRDVFKLGIFHNAVAFGAIDRTTNRDDKLGLANALGIGAHALIIDEFQLDAYFGVGWSSKAKFDKGGALAIRQAF